MQWGASEGGRLSGCQFTGVFLSSSTTFSSLCCRFYFKTRSADGSAPYELLLVEDDAALLPVFEGCVSAECRCASDSD